MTLNPVSFVVTGRGAEQLAMRKSREAREASRRMERLIAAVEKQFCALSFRLHYSKQACTTCPLDFPSIPYLCRKCRNLKLGHFFKCLVKLPDDEVLLPDVAFPFGHVKDVARRKKCGLCSAVSQAIQNCVRLQYRDILP